MNYADILRLAAIILFPLVPAFVLFRFLPTTANIEGPFQGLVIKLSGAFGAYFVVLLLAMQVAKSTVRVETWQVRGDIKLEGRGVSPTVGRMFLSPPRTFIDPSGHFSFPIAVNEDRGNPLDTPNLLIDYTANGYDPVTVVLDPHGRLADQENRVFDLGTIVLSKPAAP